MLSRTLVADAERDAATAAAHLRRYIAIADRHGRVDRIAEARMSLALVLDDLGRPAAAVREIERAVAVLTGPARARARMQRAIILRRLGREDEALAEYGAALTSFRRNGDELWQARALTNRGVLQAYRGAHSAAERDLRGAETLYARLGQSAAVAQVRHNLGFVAARAGDVPAALRWYDLADEHFRHTGRPTEALVDRAEVLLQARLWPEARDIAQAAAESAATARLESLLPQARLLQAQAALAAGDQPAALAAAAAARAAFRRQGRTGWTALADYVVWRASPGATISAARRLAERLDAAGWAEHAIQARILAAEAPPRQPTSAAVADLARAVVTVRRGPALLRVRTWYGRALTRLHAGNRFGAKRALAAAVRVVDAYRDTFGAAELRANISAEGAHMAALGLRLSLADGDAREVLAWAERRRAATLRLAERVWPTTALTAPLLRLRRVMADLSTLDLDPVEQVRLLRQQHALEEKVRRLTWRAPGVGSDRRRPVTDMLAVLGGAALVELVELDGALNAVVAAGRRVALRHLGGVDEVTSEAVSLRFAQRRLALRQGTARSLAAARIVAGHAAQRLDSLIFAPLRRLIGDRPLVVVPTGELHVLAWPLLATCRGRTLQVAPSASLWCVARTAGPVAAGPPVLVAPPAPPHAAEEVSRIGRAQPEATVLSGAQARVADVLAAIDGAHVAHLAAHGRFRADNPLFSRLSMADGPLTVHDLLRLRRPPSLLVLSACDAGMAAVREGDELMGFTSAVLGLGARAVVASVGPVDDEATATLMVELHGHLQTGAALAEALAAAQAATATDPYASTYSFVCFGAD